MQPWCVCLCVGVGDGAWKPQVKPFHVCACIGSLTSARGCVCAAAELLFQYGFVVDDPHNDCVKLSISISHAAFDAPRWRLLQQAGVVPGDVELDAAAGGTVVVPLTLRLGSHLPDALVWYFRINNLLPSEYGCVTHATRGRCGSTRAFVAFVTVLTTRVVGVQARACGAGNQSPRVSAQRVGGHPQSSAHLSLDQGALPTHLPACACPAAVTGTRAAPSCSCVRACPPTNAAACLGGGGGGACDAAERHEASDSAHASGAGAASWCVEQGAVRHSTTRLCTLLTRSSRTIVDRALWKRDWVNMMAVEEGVCRALEHTLRGALALWAPVQLVWTPAVAPMSYAELPATPPRRVS